jgi:hypothetical protein
VERKKEKRRRSLLVEEQHPAVEEVQENAS